jgi:ACS family tartrate transporter-like MFS transporter
MANPYLAPETPPARSALDRARLKAYWRLLPLLFISYMIAYVDRNNVGFTSLTMSKDLPAFTDTVIGLGSGLFFFVGYLLLEIPSTLIVERWSARKWLSRIMISWGVIAACTALVRTPWQFYLVRFLLGLAEAGFYPGVIVYLTHWFPRRDRSKALAYFFVATPVAQFVGPLLSRKILPIGTDEIIDGIATHHPEVWGLEGWQWVFIAWGIPAVLLGVLVLLYLTDRPAQAKWLNDDEREALQAELDRERAEHPASEHMTVLKALSNAKVLILTAAYFFVVTGNYGVEFFMPRILDRWYNLKLDQVALLVILPPVGSLVGQLFVGWNSDRTGERRLHVAVPICLGSTALAILAFAPRPLPLPLTVALFVLAMTGLKAYLPAFWTLPNLFLTQAAAAGSIGLINSVGNLGGAVGPGFVGIVRDLTGSYRGGLLYLSVSMAASATIILLLGIGRRPKPVPAEPESLGTAVSESV